MGMHYGTIAHSYMLNVCTMPPWQMTIRYTSVLCHYKPQLYTIRRRYATITIFTHYEHALFHYIPKLNTIRMHYGTIVHKCIIVHALCHYDKWLHAIRMYCATTAHYCTLCFVSQRTVNCGTAPLHMHARLLTGSETIKTHVKPFAGEKNISPSPMQPAPRKYRLKKNE
jgi:hypothetical protein